nr:glycosyltransferase family 39 protein [Sphingomonas sp. Ant20]
MAVLTGAWTWPALRLTNALLGLASVAFVHAAARRTGAGPTTARLCAALFATTDILLFSIGTARNDALPAACLAAALWLIVREDRTRAGALTIGLLLAAAVAAKISYALPAAAYGLYALVHPRHRVWLVALGAVPIVAFVGWTFAVSPEASCSARCIFPPRRPQNITRHGPGSCRLPPRRSIR